jgi:hypothetical protein
MILKFLPVFITLLAHGLAEFTQVRHEVFSPNYSVNWLIDYDLQKVQFNVFVRTEGFVGFGVSPTGGMTGADILIAGIYPNGTAYYSVGLIY